LFLETILFTAQTGYKKIKCKEGTMKKLLFISILFITLGIFVFAGGEQEGATGEKEVTITVWDWFYNQEGSQGKIANAVDAAFQEMYPNITVNHESVPHPPYDVYQAAIVGKEGADVLLVHANGQKFTDMGEAFVVLDDYITDMKDQFPAATLADCSPHRDVENGIRGLPMTVQGWVWYYNKELFSEAGLDPENPPTTWDGMLDASQQLKDAGIIPIGFGKGIHAEMMIAGTLDQVLCEDEKRDLLAGDLKFTNDKIVTTFAHFQDLFQAGYMDEEGLSVPLLREKGEEFMAGKSAIFRGFVSDIFNWYEFGEALGAEKLGFISNFYFEPSCHKNVIGAAGGVAYAVPTYSDNVDAAVNYVKFTASAEGANIILRNGGAIPANLNADQSLVANQVGVDIMNKLSDSLVSPTKAFTPTTCWNVLRSHAPLLFTGEITPEEYAQEIEKARD
jgi:ABC-type glycerol-3-phosphate transport system substrate-binding protein